jgi:hypothetical protein
MLSSTVLSARGRNPLKASQAVRAEVRRRGRQPGNIAYVYGAKVDRDWQVSSLLELAALLTAEATQDITSYSCDVDVIWEGLSTEGFRGSKPDVRIQRLKRPRELWEVKHSDDIENDPRAKKHAAIQSRFAEDWATPGTGSTRPTHLDSA